MQVSTIIDYVISADLAQTKFSDIGTRDSRSEMQQKNLDALVGFVNQGVLELHKRFPIKISVEDEVIKKPSTVEDLITLPDNALELISITVDTNQYVMNGELGPYGVVVPLDDYDIERKYREKIYRGIYAKTFSYNSYMILGDVPADGVKVYFRYKDSPTDLKYASKLPMPVMYQEALINYVAYRGYSTVPSITPAGDTGFSYKKKFEDSCLRIEQNTDTLYEWANPKRLVERGFV
jgi:hypothetical protein